MLALDCLVIGAGVVGLAIARDLARANREVLLVERHGTIGSETSSRNSEVIHAGIYYPQDSLKAQLCLQGRHRLYAYCAEHGISYSQPGKLIIATTAKQIEVLTTYQAQARTNEVRDLELIGQKELSEMEPVIQGLAALWSPSTGIIDSHGLMLSLLGDFEAAGGLMALKHEVTAIDIGKRGIVLRVRGDTDTEVVARNVVNSAGLAAVRLALGMGDFSAEIGEFFARGHYYDYRGTSPFKHLVYPVAEPGGLGIHGTLDLRGQLRFGPDVEWVSEPDYHFDDSRFPQFVDAIKSYYPELNAEKLTPAYVGVRPKTASAAQGNQDFCIFKQQAEGDSCIVHLLGIESPGLTSCLAIASHVAALLGP